MKIAKRPYFFLVASAALTLVHASNASFADTTRIGNQIEDVSKEITVYMEREGIGYNELTRRLNVSPATTSRLLKGSGNITLEKISQIAELLGKTPHISFR